MLKGVKSGVKTTFKKSGAKNPFLDKGT